MKEFLSYLRNNKARFIPLIVLIFLVLATFLTLEVAKRRQELRPRALEDTAVLSFNPTTVNVAPGETFDVTVFLNTGGQDVVGADILVDFNQSLFTLTNISKPAHSVFTTYAPVDSAGNFDTTRVTTDANSSGVVEFGIVAFDWTSETLTGNLNGTMTVTTLTFQAAGSGQDTLSFVFNGLAATTDSNVVSIPPTGDPEDILAAPTSTVTVNISGAASPQPSASPSIGPSPSMPACTNRSCDDYNTNGDISMTEVQAIAGRWFQNLGDTYYDVLYDLNCDEEINALDIGRQASYWSLSCP